MLNIEVVKQIGNKTEKLFSVYAGGSHKDKMVFISGNAIVSVNEQAIVTITVTDEKSVLHN